jgi:hypothetical protein
MRSLLLGATGRKLRKRSQRRPKVLRPFRSARAMGENMFDQVERCFVGTAIIGLVGVVVGTIWLMLG